MQYIYFLQLNVGGSPSPVSAPKKARPSETGSDEVRNGSLWQIKAWECWSIVGFLKDNPEETPLIWAHQGLQVCGGRKAVLHCAASVSCDLTCQGPGFREVRFGNEFNMNYKSTTGSFLTVPNVSYMLYPLKIKLACSPPLSTFSKLGASNSTLHWMHWFLLNLAVFKIDSPGFA